MRRLCLICWHLERRNLRACSRSFKDEGASMRTSVDARLADQSREWSQHKQHSKRFEPGANWEGRSRAGRSTGSEPNRERCIYTKSSMGCRSCLKNSWGATGVWKPGPLLASPFGVVAGAGLVPIESRKNPELGLYSRATTTPQLQAGPGTPWIVSAGSRPPAPPTNELLTSTRRFKEARTNCARFCLDREEYDPSRMMQS
jgi:hypothetical protein